MNDLLKQRILRRLEALSDERGFQIIDYIEFLESKYAERQAPTNFFAKVADTVGDTMRAGKIPIKAISGTMSLMDSAGKLMKGLSAAGKAVVERKFGHMVRLNSLQIEVIPMKGLIRETQAEKKKYKLLTLEFLDMAGIFWEKP